MTPAQLRKLDRQLTEYLSSMTEGMGRTERRSAMGAYVTELLLEGERKSVEPMAVRLAGDERGADALRQRLQQCVSHSAWDDAEVRRRLALQLEAGLPGLEAFVLDDTGFAKQGHHSVGVARQYSGTLGNQGNCQVAVSLHLAGEKASGCIGLRLYLPEEWTDAPRRLREAGVPEEVDFQRKWELALAQLDEALAWGLPRRPVLADAGYGVCRQFREGLTARGLPYVVGVQSSITAWPPGVVPQLPQRQLGMRGRPPTRLRVPEGVRPLSLLRLAQALPPRTFRTVRWRQGSRGVQSSRFAAVRVHTAENRAWRKLQSAEVWLLIEWPRGEAAPLKYHLSSLPPETPLKELVRLAKLRWRVERDYQEMKGEVGLDHFEGRTWRGFHHHATLCMLAHGFLALRRARFSPGAQSARQGVDLARGARAAADSAHRPHRALPAVHAALSRRAASHATLRSD